MNRVLRDSWVAALRYGGYRQGTGSLRQKSITGEEVIGHCCLGVLKDIAAPLTWDDGISSHSVFGEQHGLTAQQITALASLNDGGASFSAIADAILVFIPVDDAPMHEAI